MPKIGTIDTDINTAAALQAVRQDFVNLVATAKGWDLSTTDRWADEGTVVEQAIAKKMGNTYADATLAEQGATIWDVNAQHLRTLLAREGITYDNLDLMDQATVDAAANILGPSAACDLMRAEGLPGLMQTVGQWLNGGLMDTLSALPMPETFETESAPPSEGFQAESGLPMGPPEAPTGGRSRPGPTPNSAIVEPRVREPQAQTNADSSATQQHPQIESNGAGMPILRPSLDTVVSEAPPAALELEVDIAPMLASAERDMRLLEAYAKALPAGLSDIDPNAAAKDLVRNNLAELHQRLEALKTTADLHKTLDDQLINLAELSASYDEGDPRLARIMGLADRHQQAHRDLQAATQLLSVHKNQTSASIRSYTEIYGETGHMATQEDKFLRHLASDVSDVRKAGRRSVSDGEQFYGKHAIPQSFIVGTHIVDIQNAYGLSAQDAVMPEHIYGFVHGDRRQDPAIPAHYDAIASQYLQGLEMRFQDKLETLGFSILEISPEDESVYQVYQDALRQAHKNSVVMNNNMSLDQAIEGAALYFQGQLQRAGLPTVDIEPFAEPVLMD